MFTVGSGCACRYTMVTKIRSETFIPDVVCARKNVLLLLGVLVVVWSTSVGGVAFHHFPATVHEVLATTRASKTAAAGESRAGVLSDNVEPIAYRIHISPKYDDPINNTSNFEGKVEIDVQIKQSTRNVKLHAGNGIKILVCTLGKLTCDIKDDILTFSHFLFSVAAGFHTIEIKYTGEFQTSNNGFYKSIYKNTTETAGEEKVLFTTQFQATHARKAFPCFDEPRFKATFQLTIDVPEGYSALSNTAIESPASTRNGITSITFKETVKMSTYLVAFIVYETESYTHSEPITTSDGVEIKTWAPSGAVENRLTEYGNNMTSRILNELEEYTGIPYRQDNIDKIDQAAISDFSAGAMENWGLITYRDTRLFFSETKDNEATRKSVAAIVAHELVHQWFGNYVTTKWWDTTWLNEGFARYMQYLILSRIEPSWRMMEQFLVDQQMSVFIIDSGDTTVPLTFDATTPEEIQQRFGTITYSKGGSFLRMISNAIGEDNFQEALQSYLESNKLSSVTPSQLFEKFDEFTPDERKPVGGLQNVLEMWTSLTGFPVVTVTRFYDDNNKTITVTQERFYSDGPKEETSTDAFYIPLTWTTKVNDTPHFAWVSEDYVSEHDLEIDEWILVHARGYYRVNYDPGNWLALMWSMLHENRALIAAEDRAQLFDDSLSLAAAGFLSYSSAETMMRCLPGETDLLPWAAVTRNLEKLDFFLGNTDSVIFYDFVKGATESVYNALEGFSNKGDMLERIHRATVLGWACRAGNEDCKKNAVELLMDNLSQEKELDPNLKNVILCYGTMYGEPWMKDALWDTYKHSTDTTERASLISALGCSTERTTIHWFLGNVSLGLDGAQSSDAEAAFAAALSHPQGILATVDFVMQNFNDIQSWLSENNDTSTFYNILRNVASHITTESHYKEFSALLERQFEEQLMEEYFVDELEANMENNVKWVKMYSNEALNALKSATKITTTIAPPATTPSAGYNIKRNRSWIFITLIISFLTKLYLI